MAEPELGPSRRCSGAQAFASAEQENEWFILNCNLIPLERELCFKYCFCVTVPCRLFLCGCLRVRVGVGATLFIL